jgi:PAS domain-containing protein
VTNGTFGPSSIDTFAAMEGSARPLELILARNLLASLSTPGFLIDEKGSIAFYNEAAGDLLGRRFEDAGPMPAEEWTAIYGPLGDDGQPINWRDLPLSRPLLGNRPAHATFPIRSADGAEHLIESSGLPIMGAGGYRGALVVFWPADGESPA